MVAEVIEGAPKFGDVFAPSDGSTDTTAKVSQRSGAAVLSQGLNYG